MADRTIRIAREYQTVIETDLIEAMRQSCKKLAKRLETFQEEEEALGFVQWEHEDGMVKIAVDLVTLADACEELNEMPVPPRAHPRAITIKDVSAEELSGLLLSECRAIIGLDTEYEESQYEGGDFAVLDVKDCAVRFLALMTAYRMTEPRFHFRRPGEPSVIGI